MDDGDAAAAVQRKKVETDVGRLFDTYRRLLGKAVVHPDFAAQDAFEIDTTAAMIVHHAEALLDYIEMRRRELILAREAEGK